MKTYLEYLQDKSQMGGDGGFTPTHLPKFLFPFQRALLEWAIGKGRCATFADCGLGKTPMQLVWAQNVVQHTNGRVLILAPLAVGAQTCREAAKFDIECTHSRDGSLSSKIIVTNYQQLHKFNWQDFTAVACDESSILKNFDGAIKQEVTEFMRKLPYRSLWTATAAPNDYIELGTSSDALGYMKRTEMLAMFFTHDGGDTAKWRLKGHAIHKFWRWVCSWARAMRCPGDLGFSNDGFVLPELKIREHVVSAETPLPGYLFDMPAHTLDEQRVERRRTLQERCEMAAKMVASVEDFSVCWCYLNSEGELLKKLIPGAVEITGAHADEEKEEMLEAFSLGQIKKLITKPTIAGFGMNWQHCAHQTFFPSHSFEQWYQAVRRCWRFGQNRPVTVDMITSEGERGAMENVKRKSEQAAQMFSLLVKLMGNDMEVNRSQLQKKQSIQFPKWI